MEKTIGIHRDWVQPSYCPRPSTAGGSGARPAGRRAERRGRCSSRPAPSTTATRWSRAPRSRCSSAAACASTSAYERCCGMPFTDAATSTPRAGTPSATSPRCLPHVRARRRRAWCPAPRARCMLKNEYPKLLGTRRRAPRRGRDAGPDGVRLRPRRARSSLDREFRERLGKVAYHAPCHLRAQNIGFRSRDAAAPRGRRGRAGRRLLRRRRHLGHAGALPRGVARASREEAARRASSAPAPSTSRPTARSRRCASRRASAGRPCTRSCCCATPTASRRARREARSTLEDVLDLDALRGDPRAPTAQAILAHKRAAPAGGRRPRDARLREPRDGALAGAGDGARRAHPRRAPRSSTSSTSTTSCVPGDERALGDALHRDHRARARSAPSSTA